MDQLAVQSTTRDTPRSTTPPAIQSANRETDLQILNSYGFFSITALTRRGEHWLDTNVQGANDGVAHCDDTQMAYEIYQGALADGLGVEAERV